jgi:hypothetical protein
VPRYRLVFPPPPGSSFEQAPTAEIESEVFYEVGDTIRWEGRLWQVSQAPLEQPRFDEIVEIMVWPAEVPPQSDESGGATSG